jgi:hypothetical protein
LEKSFEESDEFNSPREIKIKYKILESGKTKNVVYKEGEESRVFPELDDSSNEESKDESKTESEDEEDEEIYKKFKSKDIIKSNLCLSGSTINYSNSKKFEINYTGCENMFFSKKEFKKTQKFKIKFKLTVDQDNSNFLIFGVCNENFNFNNGCYCENITSNIIYLNLLNSQLKKGDKIIIEKTGKFNFNLKYNKNVSKLKLEGKKFRFLVSHCCGNGRLFKYEIC